MFCWEIWRRENAYDNFHIEEMRAERLFGAIHYARGFSFIANPRIGRMISS